MAFAGEGSPSMGLSAMFWNPAAVTQTEDAQVETQLTARAFLTHLLDVERRLGRERIGQRWGPRTIDLDLLLWGDERISEPGIEVPHPLMLERRFVLEPLAALAPDQEIPGNGTVSDALAGLQSDP